MEQLKNKIAIVTGAGSGIGRQIALTFAEEGAGVVVADLNQSAAQRVAEEIKQARGRAVAMALDVAKESDWTQLIERTVEHYGKLNILVNNAGISGEKSLFEVTGEELERLFGVMVFGPVFGMKCACPAMHKAGEHGSIVNISSIAGPYFASPNALAYCGAKAALVGITKAAAVDLSGMDINVNTVHPGSVATPMSERIVAEHPEIATRQLKKIPVGRFAQPLDVARAVCFLASDAAAYIHGTSLVVDGGQTLGYVAP